MKLILSITKWMLAFAVAIAATGCAKSDLDQDEPQSGYGYVQLRLYKSGSYTRADRLEYLYDAAKIKITLQSSDNNIISQTMNVDSASKDLAEYGIQSDKFLLLTDKYTVLSFDVYDKLDQLILSSEPDETTVISVISGGLVVQDIVINTVNRGHIKFQLTKDLSEITRADNDGADKYPFHAIMYADVTVQNQVTSDVTTFKTLKMTHKTLTPDDNPDYYTSICETDSIVTIEGGTYKVIGFKTYFDRDRKVAEVSNNVAQNEFVVRDNKVTVADVPITLHEASGHIKDAITLKKIWDALDGPNWSVKWDFDRDVDLWAAQPGVSILENGRIARLTLTGTGAKGDMPAALGDLEELRSLYIGNHEFDTGTSNVNPTKSVMTLDELTAESEAVRKSFQELYVDNSDPLSRFSEEMQLSFTLNGIPVKKSPAPRDLPNNNPINYSTLITSLPAEINNLKKLESLYIAFCPIEELPTDLSGLESLTDLEVFYCPKMTEFPMGLATLPKLRTITFSTNNNIPAAEMTAGLTAMNNGAIANSIQSLQLPSQPLEVVPDLTAMVRLSLINVQSCGVKSFATAFGKRHQFAKFLAGHNELETLPKDSNGYFIGIEDIEEINFSYNKFKVFPNIFSAESGYSMDLVDFSFNEIEKFEGVDSDDFKGINVKVFSLAFNKLGRFPRELFTTESRITYLMAQGNGIEELEDEDFEGKYTYAMTTLDLSYNKLSALPRTFNNATFPYMTGVDLSFNRFSTFPTRVLNLSSLTVFIFRHQRDENGNRIMKTWPQGIYVHKGLRALFLGSNDLRKIEDTLSYLISTFEISDNPNISIDVTDLCPYISRRMMNFYYDPSQDIRGCDALVLDK